MYNNSWILQQTLKSTQENRKDGLQPIKTFKKKTKSKKNFGEKREA